MVTYKFNPISGNLDLVNDTQKVTEVEKNALSANAGDIVYQTDGTIGFYWYDGAVWQAFTSPTPPSLALFNFLNLI